MLSGRRLDLLNPALKPQVQAGGRMLASDYIRRWKLAADTARTFKARWDHVDVIALPTQSNTPPTIAELASGGDRRGDANEMRNTDWVSLLRLCAISMPAALDDAGIPVGLQLVAPAMAEERLIAMATACERVLGTARQRIGRPPLCSDDLAT